jgi:hypothetical protein
MGTGRQTPQIGGPVSLSAGATMSAFLDFLIMTSEHIYDYFRQRRSASSRAWFWIAVWVFAVCLVSLFLHAKNA